VVLFRIGRSTWLEPCAYQNTYRPRPLDNTARGVHDDDVGSAGSRSFAKNSHSWPWLAVITPSLRLRAWADAAATTAHGLAHSHSGISEIS
jgi:hypothetical protein